MKSIPWSAIAALLSATLVAAGAFGAHALKAKLSPEMLSVFETGIRYAWYHVLGLFICDFLIFIGLPTSLLDRVAGLLLIGLFLFSGSLVTLSLTEIKWLGMIAPLGGTAWIIAWLYLAYILLWHSKNPNKKGAV